MDIAIRRPKKKEPAKEQLQLPFSEYTEGWTGMRYLLCADGQWHLVLEIREGFVVDTQCSADTQLVQQEEASKTQYPMCSACTALQAARWKTGVPRTPKQ